MNLPSPQGPSAGSVAAAVDPPRRRGLPLLPLAMLLLALLDLRTDLALLFDHFTLTTLLTAISAHPLAVLVLLAQPSLWRHYRSSRT